MALLAALLDAPVAVAERLDDPPGTPLFPEEEACIARAVESRRREFATVRLCAREALAALGEAAAPIARADGPAWARRAPRWPAGTTGSLTHCPGYRGAAAARVTAVAAVGIDAEPHRPLPDGIDRVVASARERAALAALAEQDASVAWDRVLFSAKESVYKAWFPLTGAWLGFDDCVVELEPGGTFTASVLVSPQEFQGRWRVTPTGHVLTATVVPA